MAHPSLWDDLGSFFKGSKINFASGIEIDQKDPQSDNQVGPSRCCISDDNSCNDNRHVR